MRPVGSDEPTRNSKQIFAVHAVCPNRALITRMDGDLFEVKQMAKWEVKPGQVFGKLTVVSDVFKRKNRPYAVFQCDCGKRKEMFVYNVMNGQIKIGYSIEKALTMPKRETHSNK